MLGERSIESARVHATFEESEVMFDLPLEATLEQLATMLAAAGRGHGSPVSVEVIVTPGAAG